MFSIITNNLPKPTMNPIIFCDFDGTITAEETFVAMLKEFAPEKAGKLYPYCIARK